MWAQAEWLDRSTRWLYSLMTAAVSNGVRRVVLLSTLDLFLAYSPRFTVTSAWEPRPVRCQRPLTSLPTEVDD